MEEKEIVKNDAKTSQEIALKVSIETMQDEEFFESLLSDEDRKPRVARNVAREEFGRLLKNWKVLKKALRKAKAKDIDIRESYEGAKELIVSSIMDGTLEIHKNNSQGYKIRHNLLQPIQSVSGEILHEYLEYSKVPKVVDLRKMDEFDDNANIAKTQALAAALCGKSTAELAQLSSADLDVIGALFLFFV
jgi:hypothetical protein